MSQGNPSLSPNHRHHHQPLLTLSPSPLPPSRCNLELQRTERELREELVTSVPRQEMQEVQTKLHHIQEVEVLLRVEVKAITIISIYSQSDYHHDHKHHITSLGTPTTCGRWRS